MNQEENDKEENKEIKIEKTKDINKEEIAKNVFIQNENDREKEKKEREKEAAKA